MAPKHKEDQQNSIRRIRLKEIEKIISGIPEKPDTQYLEHWEAMWERGQSELANKVRHILSTIPKSYNLIEPSIKTIAKNRFVAFREQQAKGEWKKLSEEDQQRWIDYVEHRTPYEVIREEEISRG